LAEAEARGLINNLLISAGWSVQDFRREDFSASLGVAVREFQLKTGAADYLLFINRKVVGVIEAKPVGHTLGGVDVQSEKYVEGVVGWIEPLCMDPDYPIPFLYESTGVVTYFRDLRDPDSRSRKVFAFHRPETLRDWLKESDTLRGRLRGLPPLEKRSLRDCQFDAILNLEQSLKDQRPRALIQMATGSGKTYMIVEASYRLIKHAKARRILFLVDRNNLGKQAFREYRNYRTPEGGRRFEELYNIQHMTSNSFDDVSKVTICTIQRLYSMLTGEERDPESDEESLEFPIETFDFIVTDECHRSIYNLWSQVLEYFDAFIIGLTATPSRDTLGFFNQNLVMEYSHLKAVADRVNVGYDVYYIQTAITRDGSKIPAGFNIRTRDITTRRELWELTDEPVTYAGTSLDRDVVSPDQIRTVIQTFKEKLFTEIFPDRKQVPKTIIFSKNDSHADDILHTVREEFGKGNDFAKKITYKTTGEKPENLIKSFRNSPLPRIVVSVDMIATGTDIRPVECLLFMRDVKSRVYFEQMKGRGTRVISPTELRGVTSDAYKKTHFVIVDAIGVTDSDNMEIEMMTQSVLSQTDLPD
jgi:type I restriction enzyme R subunit